MNLPVEPEHAKQDACDACGAPVRYDGVCENEDCPYNQSAPDTETETRPPKWVVERSGNTWIVKEYETDTTGRYIYEGQTHKGRRDARLIAAAGCAAHALPPEYDPVGVLAALPQIIDAAEEILDADWRRIGSKESVSLINALQKARSND